VWLLGAVDPGAAAPPPLAARLGGVVLELPPLAGRIVDLPALAADVLARIAGRAGTPPPAIAPGTLARLAEHAWPGDLAELEAVLARAMLVAGDRTIEPDDLALDAAPAGRRRRRRRPRAPTPSSSSCSRSSPTSCATRW
jgi:DNA-binding NtrC family response regulator